MSRILVLPQAARLDFFIRLLQSIQPLGVRIVLDAKASLRAYRPYCDAFKAFPSISAMSRSEFDRCTDLLESFQAIEEKNLFSLNRIVLAAERNVGRGFGLGSYDWPSNTLLKRALNDTDYPRRYLLSLFRWVKDFLDDHQLDLVIAGSTNNPINLLFFLEAKERNIPFLSARPSKVLSDRMYLTDDLLMFNSDSESCFERTVNANTTRAANYISNFRSDPKIVSYIARNWKTIGKEGFLEQNRRLFVMAIMSGAHLLSPSNSQSPKPFFSTARSFYFQKLKSLWFAKHYETFSEEALSSKPFVYFPLHKEPELALNLQASEWHDQLNTVSRLATVLPARYQLLVKEHRYNLGRRPGSFLKRILSMPGVRLIDPFESQWKYLSHAALVVTDNGSTGWEALVLGKPVLTLDNTFYDLPKLTYRLQDFPNLNAALMNALLKNPRLMPEYDAVLQRFVEAEFQSTLDDNDPDWENKLCKVLENHMTLNKRNG